MTAGRWNREQLVGAAHDFVSVSGLDALTMRRLASAAGLTPGALYKHFRGKRDLQRAMADAVYATVELSDIDTEAASIAPVVLCCQRMRGAMLQFRDGGRVVAGSYSPFAATARIGDLLRTLLRSCIRSGFDAGDIAFALRNYTVGFVIEEQAYLALVEAGEWESLTSELARSVASVEVAGAGSDPSQAGSGTYILDGDRDARFLAGLQAILTGVVEPA